MRADLPLVQAAALGLVGSLRASDRGAVVTVRENAGIPQPFTSDRALIERAIRGLSMSGATALYDGLYIVLKEFERERRAALQVRRQALVVLSDGLDNRSRLGFEEVLDLARRVDVNIYVVALRGDAALIPREMRDRSMLQADYAMGAVARESGGRTFLPKSARELPAIYTAIAAELASQYRAGVHAGAARRRRRVQACRGQRAPTDEWARAHANWILRRAREAGELAAAVDSLAPVDTWAASSLRAARPHWMALVFLLHAIQHASHGYSIDQLNGPENFFQGCSAHSSHTSRFRRSRRRRQQSSSPGRGSAPARSTRCRSSRSAPP